MRSLRRWNDLPKVSTGDPRVPSKRFAGVASGAGRTETLKRRLQAKDSPMRAILIGAGEVGGYLVEALQGEEIDLITVDNDPEVIERLRIQYPKVRTVLGDVTDPQLRAELDLPNADRFLTVADRVVPRSQRAPRS